MDRAGRGLVPRSGVVPWGSVVPRGSASTLVGIVISGLCGFGALAVATRGVPDEQRSALAAAWTLVFLVGPAVFFPVEQALAGLLLRPSGAPSARTVARVSAGLVVGLSALALTASPAYLDDLLDGRPGLLGAVVLSFAGFAAQHVLRAVLLARGDFRRYAVVLGVDGLVRLVGCLLVPLSGTQDAEAYTWVIALAPLVATAACLPRRTGRSHPDQAASPAPGGLGTDVALLIVASLCAQTVVGAGPAVLKLVAEAGQDAVVASYLVTASLTRIPLLLGQALLAPLLAGLGAALASAKLDDYRRQLGAALAAVLGVGVVTTIGFALTAPTVVPLLFGDDHDFGRGPAAVLAASAMTFLAAQLLTQALVAQGRVGYVARSWLLALAVAAVTVAAFPGDLARVLAATLLGCLTAALVLAPAALRSGVGEGPDVAPG